MSLNESEWDVMFDGMVDEAMQHNESFKPGHRMQFRKRLRDLQIEREQANDEIEASEDSQDGGDLDRFQRSRSGTTATKGKRGLDDDASSDEEKSGRSSSRGKPQTKRSSKGNWTLEDEDNVEIDKRRSSKSPASPSKRDNKNPISPKANRKKSSSTVMDIDDDESDDENGNLRGGSKMKRTSSKSKSSKKNKKRTSGFDDENDDQVDQDEEEDEDEVEKRRRGRGRAGADSDDEDEMPSTGMTICCEGLRCLNVHWMFCFGSSMVCPFLTCQKTLGSISIDSF
jgi:hypothetical protein